MNKGKIKIQKIFAFVLIIIAVLFLVSPILILAEEDNCYNESNDYICGDTGSFDNRTSDPDVVGNNQDSNSIDNNFINQNQTAGGAKSKTAQANVSCDQQYPWCEDEKTDIGDLIGKFYNYALAAVGVTALGVIIWGGILYTVSAGNPSKQQEGIQWITGAVWGLVLLLGANLLLRTINPKLTSLELGKLGEANISTQEAPKFPAVSTPMPKTGGGTTVTGGTESHIGEDIREKKSPIIGKISQEGQKLRQVAQDMTKDNSHVIIDKSDKKAYFYKDNKLVSAININIGGGDLNAVKTGGKNGDKITPEGNFTIENDKRLDVFNGVYNKEGTHMGVAYMGLSAKDENGQLRGIGFHGSSDGTINKSTNGCIRVANADLGAIYTALKPGTRVKIQN